MKLCTSIALVALVAGPVAAAVTTGGIEGKVLDSDGDPISNVDVAVTSPSLQGTRRSVASAEGQFRLLALPVGAYRVEFSHVGYQVAAIEGVPVRLGTTTGLGEKRLKTRVHGVPEVTVWGTRPLIDPSSTIVGENFSSRDYASLPTERNYRSIVTLTPQVNQSFLGDAENFGGSTGNENKYFFDGVETTDPYTAHTGMTLPYNFVEEIQVRSGGYEAQYRSSMGGVVDVLTLSGGNEFHGQLFSFLTSDRLSDDPKRVPGEPSPGSYMTYDVGFGLGGPILRDRLWFFAAYDPSVETEDVVIPGHGDFEDRETTHRFATKLTWQANERNNVALTLIGDPINRCHVRSILADLVETPDPCLFDIHSGGCLVSLRGSHRLSDALLINTTFSRHYDKYHRKASTEQGREEPRFIDYTTDTWSGGGGIFQDNLGTRSTVGASATWIAGSHTAKAGFEYVENRLRFDEAWVVVERFDSSDYSLFEWIGQGAAANRLASGFMQDSWRLGDRLRINAGLRWDGQFLVATDGKVAQTITDQWQPRVGVTYLPGRIGSQKVSAAYGRFYQDLPTSVLMNYYCGGVIWRQRYYDHDPRVDPSGWYFEMPFAQGIQPEIEDMEGQYYDTFTFGYEREVLAGARMLLRGIHRTLGQALDNGYYLEPEIRIELNNPGKGAMSGFPKARHEYTALEISVRKSVLDSYGVFASYVLSRTYGNYPGLYDQDWEQGDPNISYMFTHLEIMENATGLLPNDRTHVFKCSGFYRIGHGLSAGGSLSWMSGTPLSEWGGSYYGQPIYTFIDGRGKAGRTPSIWDLNLRFTYELPAFSRNRWQPRLILDLYHVGSPRTAVDYDQLHYTGRLDEEGNQDLSTENDDYGEPIRFQPPMAVRLGLELEF
jgi:hypothetical protein